MKTYTDVELRQRAERYCVTAERCLLEVKQKLRQWEAAPETIDKILEFLLKARYVDEQRYSKAFVRDKYRFNKWGRVKIMQMLQLKKISPEDIDAGLDEIDEQEYFEGLKELLSVKSRSVTARNVYERQAKLIRFAVGRGYTIDEAKRCVEHEDADEFFE